MLDFCQSVQTLADWLPLKMWHQQQSDCRLSCCCWVSIMLLLRGTEVDAASTSAGESLVCWFIAATLETGLLFREHLSRRRSQSQDRLILMQRSVKVKQINRSLSSLRTTFRLFHRRLRKKTLLIFLMDGASAQTLLLSPVNGRRCEWRWSRSSLTLTPPPDRDGPYPESTGRTDVF